MSGVQGFEQTIRLAVMGFLARYRGATLRAYGQDLQAFLRWCAACDLQPLQAGRPQLEPYLRCMEQRGYAPTTISRRFATVAGLYRYAVVDGHLAADPTVAVSRPKAPWEAQRRTVLHPLGFEALLTAARRDAPHSHALVALLGVIGLRVGETCRLNVTDLRPQAGYELLHVFGKGSKPGVIPLPVPVLRAVREAIDGRSGGPPDFVALPVGGHGGDGVQPGCLVVWVVRRSPRACDSVLRSPGGGPGRHARHGRGHRHRRGGALWAATGTATPPDDSTKRHDRKSR